MTPLTDDALAAIEARADDAAREALRRVRYLYDTAPPEDGDRTPAIRRVTTSLAGGYSTVDLDRRDVGCLVVAFDDAEGIIDSLNGQLAAARAEVARLRAHAAGESERVAAAVATITNAVRSAADKVAMSALRARTRAHGATQSNAAVLLGKAGAYDHAETLMRDVIAVPR